MSITNKQIIALYRTLRSSPHILCRRVILLLPGIAHKASFRIINALQFSLKELVSIFCVGIFRHDVLLKTKKRWWWYANVHFKATWFSKLLPPRCSFLQCGLQLETKGLENSALDNMWNSKKLHQRPATCLLLHCISLFVATTCDIFAPWLKSSFLFYSCSSSSSFQGTFLPRKEVLTLACRKKAKTQVTCMLSKHRSF